MATKTERVKTCQTLACLLKALCGQSTTIELRNELVVEGKISDVDSHMNVTVVNATFRKLNGESTKFDQMFILGNQIRYVHLPEDLDVMAAITSQISALLDHSKKGEFKRSRMQRSKLDKHQQQLAAARAFKMGRGRGRGLV